MADRFPKVLFISLMLILTFLLCTPPPRKQGEEQSTAIATNSTRNSTEGKEEEIEGEENLPEEMKSAYRGSWSTDSPNLFGRLNSTNGRCYFECHPGKSQVDCRLYLFDGVWEDDTLYLFALQNVTFNASRRDILIQNHTAGVYSVAERHFANCQVDGNVTYAGEGSQLEVWTAFWGVETEFELKTEMKELTEDERKYPRKTYCVIFSLLSLVMVLTFKSLEKTLTDSPRTAGKVTCTQISIGFLLGNAVIDAFLCLWHLNIAFQDFFSFDYLLLSSFWSFFTFMLVQVRLTPLVWKAHNQEAISWGSIRAREAFHAFQNRFLLCVLLWVLMLVLFAQAFEFTVLAMHCFFVPQIVTNAYYGYKNSIKCGVYLPIGAVRLALVVSAIQLYLFGCPANFLVWQPRMWLCVNVGVAVAVQIVVLRLQNSRSGPRFFVPEAYRPAAYNYFRSFDEERGIEGSVSPTQTECIICMSVLNIPQAKREEVTNTSKTMHAPCGHRFHTDCLENWMKLKLECPTCRGPLPALEEEDV